MKLSKEEIIESIEHCTTSGCCLDCKLFGTGGDCDVHNYEDEIFEIILEQKREIERLSV